MKTLILLLIAGALSAQAPVIAEAERTKYRETERDYWRFQAQAAAAALSINAQLKEFAQRCGAAGFDEQALACHVEKK